MNRVILFSLEYIERGLHGNFVKKENYQITPLAYCLYYLQIPVYCLLWFSSKIPLINQIYETLSRCWSRGIVGFFLRGAYWKANLGSCGINVFIDQNASAFGMKNIHIGNDTHIDTGVVLLCATGLLKIGNYCHIANNVIINGKPFLFIGDHTALAAGSKVYGSTTKPTGRSMSPMSPEYMIRTAEVGVTIGSNVLIGLNSTVVPGAKIGNGVCVGANSLVNNNIPDNMIVMGCPARIVKKREFDEI